MNQIIFVADIRANVVKQMTITDFGREYHNDPDRDSVYYRVEETSNGEFAVVVVATKAGVETRNIFKYREAAEGMIDYLKQERAFENGSVATFFTKEAAWEFLQLNGEKMRYLYEPKPNN